MREIKFRAISAETDKWVYGSLWTLADTAPRMLCLDRIASVAVIGATVGQFTGLLDKDGKAIFEGDILKCCNGSINGHPWWEKPFAVAWKSNGTFELPRYCWDKEGRNTMDSTHWCEVIGNIHENPELLERKEND